MTLSQALSRFNENHPWDHNAYYHRLILRRLPRRFDTALDVGCGTGDLARLMATRAKTVHGIDADPTIISRARELTAAPITYTVADALTEIPLDSYDAITCVAVIHHLPFAEGLTQFRKHLAPGGTLVIVGIAREKSAIDFLLAAPAIVPNLVIGWLKNRGRRADRPVSMTAVARPPTMSYADIAREAAQIMPGAKLRRRLFWRYTLVWRKPAA
jgi:2-polyprenyl-3-methyl-5-hydroxy-6-metoxy-1,4-benzoquinol methylase